MTETQGTEAQDTIDLARQLGVKLRLDSGGEVRAKGAKAYPKLQRWLLANHDEVAGLLRAEEALREETARADAARRDRIRLLAVEVAFDCGKDPNKLKAAADKDYDKLDRMWQWFAAHPEYHDDEARNQKFFDALESYEAKYDAWRGTQIGMEGML